MRRFGRPSMPPPTVGLPHSLLGRGQLEALGGASRALA
jgi:hypothetical protein